MVDSVEMVRKQGISEFQLSEVLPIQEVSVVRQGEGKFCGVPSILIRTTGCRLRCCFKTSICDTYYCSFTPQKGEYTLLQLNEIFNKYPMINHCFITGGGPTLHPMLLVNLVTLAQLHNHHVTIETEGSEYVRTDADFISLSPKLKSSTPVPGKFIKLLGRELTEKDKAQHEKYRTNYQAMKMLISHAPDYQMKVVITDNIHEDFIEVKELQEELNVPNHKVWLMPEGSTREELEVVKQRVYELGIREGYNFTSRLHIDIYGNKRGV